MILEAAHLNWAISEGMAHVGGQSPPRWARRPMRMGEGPREVAWPPRETLGRSPSSLAQPPPLSWRRGRCLLPSPYIKTAPGGEESTQLSLSHCLEGLSSLSLHHLSLSH